MLLVWQHQRFHRIPLPTLVTIAKRPSYGSGTAQACRDDLPDRHSGIFFARGLDDPNQVELPDEISFCAHAIFKSARARLGR
jgi:hypothetical protein